VSKRGITIVYWVDLTQLIECLEKEMRSMEIAGRLLESGVVGVWASITLTGSSPMNTLRSIVGRKDELIEFRLNKRVFV